MTLRKWCVAWDASPFGIRIETRHHTQRAAKRALRRIRPPQYRNRCYITTTRQAHTDNHTVQTRYDAWFGTGQPLPDTFHNP